MFHINIFVKTVRILVANQYAADLFVIAMYKEDTLAERECVTIPFVLEEDVNKNHVAS